MEGKDAKGGGGPQASELRGAHHGSTTDSRTSNQYTQQVVRQNDR